MNWSDPVTFKVPKEVRLTLKQIKKRNAKPDDRALRPKHVRTEKSFPSIAALWKLPRETRGWYQTPRDTCPVQISQSLARIHWEKGKTKLKSAAGRWETWKRRERDKLRRLRKGRFLILFSYERIINFIMKSKNVQIIEYLKHVW